MQGLVVLILVGLFLWGFVYLVSIPGKREEERLKKMPRYRLDVDKMALRDVKAILGFDWRYNHIREDEYKNYPDDIKQYFVKREDNETKE